MKTLIPEITNTIPAGTIVDFHRACTAAGLKPNEYIVLAALVEGASLIDGEPNVAMSRYEIATRTGLSWQQAQRALTELHSGGFIGRRQNAKKSGEVSVTLVSARAYALFGLSGGAEIGPSSLPKDFWGLLAGESESLISEIASHWKNGSVPDAALATEFRGGGRAWAQVEFLLTAQVEALEMERMSAFEEATKREEEEATGRFTLDLPDGSAVVFDQAALRDETKSEDVAIRSANLRFARDTLAILCSRNPKAVSRGNVVRLAAEILFSRQKGFVWKHDYGDACKVLACVIGRGGWKQPVRMDRRWYQVCETSVHTGYAQGVRFCAA